MAEEPLGMEYERFKEQDPENGNFDVSFKINDQKLSSKSNVFQEIFNRQLNNSNPIEITTASFEAFKEFVSYFYHLSFNFNLDFIIEVLELATEYQVKPLIDLYNKHLWSVMRQKYSNFKLYEPSSIISLQKYQKRLQSFYNWTQQRTLREKDFMKASKKAILGILTLQRGKDDIAESLLFEKVVLWVENQANIMNLNNPEEYIKIEVATLLPKFDFKKISFYFLKSFTVTHRSIFPSPEYIEDILNRSDKSMYKAICGNYYILSRPARQNFGFLPSMMNYLTKHWSAEVYQKLIKTCKHFFYTHRIVVVKDMEFHSSKGIIPFIPGWFWVKANKHIDLDELMYFIAPSRSIVFDLSIKKLWVTGMDWFIRNNPTLHKHIYASDLKSLWVNTAKLPYLFETFAIFAPKLTILEICCDIYFGTKVLTLGDILSCTPNLVQLELRTDSRPSLWNISRSIAPGLPTLPKLHRFSLEIISDASAFPNLLAMVQFIKNHDAKFLFKFSKQDAYNSFKTAVSKAYPDSEKDAFTEVQGGFAWYTFPDFPSKICIMKR